MNCFRKILAAFAGVAFCFGPAFGQEPSNPDAGTPKTARSKAAENPFRALFLVQTYQQVAVSPDEGCLGGNADRQEWCPNTNATSSTELPPGSIST